MGSTQFGGVCHHFLKPNMVKKAGICWHFETVQTHIRLTVETDTSFFPVFQVNLLNETDILAIIDGKIPVDNVVFDRKRFFLRYLSLRVYE